MPTSEDVYQMSIVVIVNDGVNIDDTLEGTGELVLSLSMCLCTPIGTTATVARKKKRRSCRVRSFKPGELIRSCLPYP